MKIIILDNDGKPLSDPYIIRIQNWTEERYYRESPEDRKCEYVRGEMIMSAAMSFDHGDLVGFLYYLLKGYCDTRGLGKVVSDVTIRLMAEVNREPDIAFFPLEKSPPRGSKVPITIIPSLIIEVSHASRYIDLWEKVSEYETAGVEEYWVVDMEEEETVVHTLQEGKYKKETKRGERISSKAVGGFYVEESWLWRDPRPSACECLQEILSQR